MNIVARALTAGAAGALATNLSHEIVRRILPAAPRVDILGMQALAKAYVAIGIAPPTGRDLYAKTLAGDLISNALYFSICSIGREFSPVVGGMLGVAAGIGAFSLPPRLDLDEKPTGRTTTTKILTTSLYTLGGLAAGLTFASLRDVGET